MEGTLLMEHRAPGRFAERTLVQRMVAGDETVLGEYLTAYPQADRQQIRQLIRNAQRELSTGKPPKSRRELFRLLRAGAWQD